MAIDAIMPGILDQIIQLGYSVTPPSIVREAWGTATPFTWRAVVAAVAGMMPADYRVDSAVFNRETWLLCATNGANLDRATVEASARARNAVTPARAVADGMTQGPTSARDIRPLVGTDTVQIFEGVGPCPSPVTAREGVEVRCAGTFVGRLAGIPWSRRNGGGWEVAVYTSNAVAPSSENHPYVSVAPRPGMELPRPAAVEAAVVRRFDSPLGPRAEVTLAGHTVAEIRPEAGAQVIFRGIPIGTVVETRNNGTAVVELNANAPGVTPPPAPIEALSVRQYGATGLGQRAEVAVRDAVYATPGAVVNFNGSRIGTFIEMRGPTTALISLDNPPPVGPHTVVGETVPISNGTQNAETIAPVIHRPPNSTTCPTCGVDFTTRERLLIHIRVANHPPREQRAVSMPRPSGDIAREFRQYHIATPNGPHRVRSDNDPD